MELELIKERVKDTLKVKKENNKVYSPTPFGYNRDGDDLIENLNSTLKCNSMTGCGRCGAAVGFVLFPPSKMRSTNETLQPAHAGTKIHNIFDA
jgi:hypothetical protein